MFQPQPTPFASSFHTTSSSSSSPYGVGPELPYYSFAPTPLGALQAGGRGPGAGPGPGLGPGSGQSLQNLGYEPPSPAAATHFHSPASAASSNPHSYNPRSHSSTKMEHNDTGNLPDDLAAQEAAAREYQPQLEGPLVGDKTTSDAITEEYAKADEIYVAKTINLPQTYSHYRQVQGDGNCGWRAIGFSYFENLVNTGDQSQIEGEVARITSFNQFLLNVGGYDRYLFEDMVEETIALLKELANSVASPQVAMAILMQKFNDRDCSNAIIYHLRLLASSWLKGNHAAFEPFIPGDMGISGYCSDWIERVDREIDHLGIMLLVQVLLKPLNFVLEIAYLDRSPGSEVNIYRFPDEANGQDPAALGPIIYLLYRPDHYDILYRPPPNLTPVSLQVNRATSFSHRHDIASNLSSLHSFSTDYSPLSLIPGFSGPPPGLSPLASTAGTSPMPDGLDASPHSPWLSTPFSEPFQQPAPAPPHTHAQQSSAPIKTLPPVSYPLRFSHQCFHLNNTTTDTENSFVPQNSFHEPSFSTPPLKNSHFNKAHFNNPHFHPEEWTPEDDTPEKGGSSKKKVRLKADC